MPPYAFLEGRPLDLSTLQGEMRALKAEGVPYTDAMIANAAEDAAAQAGGDYDYEPIKKAYAALSGRPDTIAFRDFDGEPGQPSEFDALIAYLQMLGTLVDFSTYEADDLSNQR